MRILLLSDTESIGGAGIAAARLARALADLGHEIAMAVNHPQAGPAAGPWQRFHLGSSPLNWEQVPNLQGEKHTLGQLQKIFTDFRPQAVSIHNLHGGLKAGWSVNLVSLCASKVPTVWTLHDMWSFTGRCAYNGSCQGYLSHCGGYCPTFDEYPFWPVQKIEETFCKKASMLVNGGMVASCPSHWLAKRAGKGLWRNSRIEVIPNGLDLETYRPLLRQDARQCLGLAQEGPFVLLAAADLNDPRKGLHFVAEALENVETNRLTLLTMGKSTDLDFSAPHVHLGFLSEKDQVTAYNAADLYLHAAKADNLPNTIAEALACGTPVVGLSCGGVPEMIEDDKTGLLTKANKIEFGRAVDRALNKWVGDDEVRRLCRCSAEQHFDPGIQARRYIELFMQLASSQDYNNCIPE